MLALSGVVHVVGGPDVLHGRVLTALLRPEERVLQHPAHDRRLRRLQVPLKQLLHVEDHRLKMGAIQPGKGWSKGRPPNDLKNAPAQCRRRWELFVVGLDLGSNGTNWDALIVELVVAKSQAIGAISSARNRAGSSSKSLRQSAVVKMGGNLGTGSTMKPC